jgi:Neprosin
LIREGKVEIPRKVDHSMKSAVQKKRTELSLPALNPDVVDYYVQRRKRLEVVKTTQTPSGQVIDWIPIESQGPIATPPPHPPKVESRCDAVRSTAIEARFELEMPGVERGPEGTVPIARPRMHLAGTGAFRKRHVDGRRLMNDPRFPPPDPFGFYHATAAASVTCYGCLSVLSLWDPHTENDGDHTISQFGIQNFDNPQLQSIEAGWICSKAQFGDNLAHLFTYYTTNGYAKDGDNLGGYNSDHAGWQQHDKNIYPGAAIAHVDGPAFPAYEMQISFDLHDGNWWFYVGNTPVGYYRGSLFSPRPGATIADHGSWAAFWGEVYSADKDPSKTTTSMGSGQHAKYGWPFTAYQRDMFIRNTAGGTIGHLRRPEPQPALTLSAEDSSLYDISMDAPGFDGFMFFGGSGTGTPWIVVY